ncbi:MAG TPA: VWA domain-containing protein [Candidatus Elarobacter sp.]
MIARHRSAVLLVLFACAALSACGGRGDSTSSSASPAPAASGAAATPEPSGAGAVSPASGASPAAAGATSTPEPTPTPDPNLLSPKNGSVIRSYPATMESVRDAQEGAAFPTPGPQAVVYELPGPAKLTRVAATLAAKADQGPADTVAFAISSSGATSGFSDIGKISSAATETEQSVPVNGQTARWVRITVTNPSGSRVAYGAFGELGPLPASAHLAGTYVFYGNPYDKGTFRSAPEDEDPWYLQAVQLAGGTTVNGANCAKNKFGDAYPGKLEGRVWTWNREGTTGHFVVNDEATMLIGDAEKTIAVRTAQQPEYCKARTKGAGATQITVLDSTSEADLYPVSAPADAPSYRFARLAAPLLDSETLAASDTVVFNMLCNAAPYFAPGQTDALLQWVAAGHKLLITDSDGCGKTRYDFLPYRFETANPGAAGARGNRLIMVESDALGTSDKTDAAHFFDPKTYVAESSQQIGDANTVRTNDPHWCGHLFGTNALNVNGFMQMYAVHGKGVIVYDGLDHDDGSLPAYQRLRKLELALPLTGPLPCSQQVAGSFVIEPNQDGVFTPGRASALRFQLEILANQGFKGTIALKTSGDVPAALSTQSAALAGGTTPFGVTLNVPADAKPGDHPVDVVGDDGSGHTAKATIVLHGRAEGRVRVISGKVKHAGRTVEVVLDESGSMKEKVTGVAKYLLARRILDDLVKKLPDGTDFALRVFSAHAGGAASCNDSELLVPPGPLNRAATVAKIDALTPRGETPLVKNLLLAAADVKAKPNPTIVVVTDGEESCNGDVAHAADKLRAMNVHLVANIVGFDIADPKTRAAWNSVSTQTGGKYFDTHSAGALGDALAEAIKLPYDVIDANKTAVASGVVDGDPARVPPGRYTVIIKRPKFPLQRPVSIESEKTATVTL